MQIIVCELGPLLGKQPKRVGETEWNGVMMQTAPNGLGSTVSRWLTAEFDSVGILNDTLFIVQFPDNVAVMVEVDSIFGGAHLRVSVEAVIASNVPANSDVLAHIGGRTGNFALGQIAIADAGDEAEGLMPVFRIAMLGDDLTAHTLTTACRIVGATVPTLTQEFLQHFGGRRITLT